MTEYMVNRPTKWKISHRWQTGIQTVLTGSEKRSAILSQPFVDIEPNYVSGDYRRSSDIRGKLFRGTHGLWRVPIWSDRAYLAEEIPSEASTDYPDWFDGLEVAGITVVIGESWRTVTGLEEDEVVNLLLCTNSPYDPAQGGNYRKVYFNETGLLFRPKHYDQQIRYTLEGLPNT